MPKNHKQSRLNHKKTTNMKNQKITLTSLKVNSFVTDLKQSSSQTIVGGQRVTIIPEQCVTEDICDPNDRTRYCSIVTCFITDCAPNL